MHREGCECPECDFVDSPTRYKPPGNDADYIKNLLSKLTTLLTTLTAERDTLAKRLAETEGLLSECQDVLQSDAPRLEERIEVFLASAPSQKQENMVMVRRDFIEEAAYKLQEAGHVVLMHYLMAALKGKENKS